MQPEENMPYYFYVSVLDGSRSARIRGPFLEHADALAAVETARTELLSLEPRSWFYAFGTCRTNTDLGPGYLDALAKR